MEIIRTLTEVGVESPPYRRCSHTMTLQDLVCGLLKYDLEVNGHTKSYEYVLTQLSVASLSVASLTEAQNVIRLNSAKSTPSASPCTILNCHLWASTLVVTLRKRTSDNTCSVKVLHINLQDHTTKELKIASCASDVCEMIFCQELGQPLTVINLTQSSWRVPVRSQNSHILRDSSLEIPPLAGGACLDQPTQVPIELCYHSSPMTRTILKSDRLRNLYIKYYGGSVFTSDQSIISEATLREPLVSTSPGLILNSLASRVFTIDLSTESIVYRHIKVKTNSELLFACYALDRLVYHLPGEHKALVVGPDGQIIVIDSQMAPACFLTTNFIMLYDSAGCFTLFDHYFDVLARGELDMTEPTTTQMALGANTLTLTESSLGSKTVSANMSELMISANIPEEGFPVFID